MTFSMQITEQVQEKISITSLIWNIYIYIKKVGPQHKFETNINIKCELSSIDSYQRNCMLVSFAKGNQPNNKRVQANTNTQIKTISRAPKHGIQHQESQTHGCAVHPMTHPSGRGRGRCVQPHVSLNCK